MGSLEEGRRGMGDGCGGGGRDGRIGNGCMWREVSGWDGREGEGDGMMDGWMYGRA